MASDSVSVTFRLSPEVVKLIDSQPGSSRTERFERPNGCYILRIVTQLRDIELIEL